MSNCNWFLALCALSLLQPVAAVSASKATMAELLAESLPGDWRSLDPENTLYLELASGRAVIDLAPDFAPHHVANVKALAREHYYDGLTITRAQDNYVVQMTLRGRSKTVSAPYRLSLSGIGIPGCPLHGCRMETSMRHRLASLAGFRWRAIRRPGRRGWCTNMGWWARAGTMLPTAEAALSCLWSLVRLPGIWIATTPCWGELCREWNSFRPCRVARHRWDSTKTRSNVRLFSAFRLRRTCLWRNARHWKCCARTHRSLAS
jgi:hypothetical protein